jgi:4-aminobutyrate aminotransferase/(S)-3-amino-2-methylpropionate transaminase
MIGIELVKSRKGKEPNPDLTAKIVKISAKRGLIILSAGAYSNVIRTLMPLCITNEQLDEGMNVLGGVLKDLS